MDTVTDKPPAAVSELFDAETAKVDLSHIANDYGGREHELRLAVAQRLKTALLDGRARAEQLLFEDRQGRACAVRLSQMQDAIIRVLYEFATTHLYSAQNPSEGEHMAIEAEGHAVLAMNTPYLGANFRVADDILYDDGCLDVFLYAGLNKLDLLAQGVAIATDGAPDPRIRRLRARRLTLRAEPPVPILVDGVNLGEGPASLQVHRAALKVLAGQAPARQKDQHSPRL